MGTDTKLGTVLSAQQMIQYKTGRDEWLGQLRTRMGMGGTSGMAPASARAPADIAQEAASAPADTAKK
jgi:hypothetical protein